MCTMYIEPACMVKVIIKLLLLPSIVLLVPLLVLLNVLRSGAISTQSIKKGLSASGVYEQALSSVQKSFLGFSMSDLASKSKGDPESAAFAKMFSSVITDTYIKTKVEKAIDDTGAWISGSSNESPTISFEDLKTSFMSKQKGNLDELNSFLSEMKDALPQEIKDSAMGDSQSSDIPVSNPFDLQSILQKNPVIQLAPFLYWLKASKWIISIGWYISWLCLGIILVLVVLLSEGKRGKLRWIGITGIYACIGFAVSMYFFRDPISGLSIISKWIPKQYAELTIGALAAVFMKPFLLFNTSSQWWLQAVSLYSVAAIAVSFLDIRKPVQQKNIIVLFVGTVAVSVAYMLVFPKAASLPFIGKFVGKSQSVVSKSSLSKTATIGSKGGTLSVVGADSTSTLEIPSKGLFYKTVVHGSPILSMSGLPQDSELIAGVDYDSSDALLTKPAKLEITLDEVPKKKLMGFAYDAGGKNLITFPVTVHESTAIIPVMHFSGYGIITVPDTFKSNEHTNDVRAQAQQDILGFMSWIQVTQAFGMNEQLTEAQKKGLRDILTDWWNRGVKPLLEQSLRDSKEIIPAAKEYTIWLQAVQALGFESDFSTTIKTSETILAKAILHAAEEASRMCIESHDPSQAGVLLKLYAIAEGLGLDGVGGLRVESLKKQALNCAQFKLTIQSRFTVEDGKVCPVGEDEAYSGEIDLVADEDFTLSGKGTVKADSIQVCAKECRIEQGDGPVEATVEIPGVIFGMSSQARDIAIPLVVTDETAVQYDCSYVVPGTDVDFGYHRPFGWDGEFYNMHDEARTGLFEYMITGWTRSGSGDAFATKIYDWVKKPTFMGMGVPVHEVTTIKLLHTPRK